jgi:hypothetical protein
MFLRGKKLLQYDLEYADTSVSQREADVDALRCG